MMALMMVLTLTQCKPDKGNEGDTQNGSKVKVSCVIPMNKNTRSEFDNLMTDGSIKWSAGTERIYLAIPNETNPQIVELTAFTTVESNILLFEGEVEAGLLTEGEYEVWYLGNSKESGNSYITETKEGDIIKSISGSIASQSGDLNDLGYCHIAKTTVTAETEGEEVVLSLNGTLKNQIAIAHLDLEGITQLKGNAIVGTEYALQYNNGAFEFAVTPDAKANINVTEGTTASYVVLFPNATANVDLKSNTSKKVTFEGGVEANKIYYKHVSDIEYYPLTWEDYEEETNTINGHEYVDLGLPSGLLWATCNVGANSPEEYGNYYAWGETETKSEYTGANSLTYGKSFNDISGNPQYDAATANWGGDWRMPTDSEQRELLNNCTWTWTTQNGVTGYKVTSKVNSNYIFLPAAGYRLGSSLYHAYAFYWSSTPYDIYYDDYAYNLNCGSGYQEMSYYDRYYGQCVRPVSGGGFVEPILATVSTDEVTEITSSSAVCGVKIISDNGFEVSARGVCWSTSETPTISDNRISYGGSSDITMSLTNLDPNTTYYVRAFAINAAGTSYGEQKSFTTLTAGPNANNHEYVDLGLPSGLLWATCNVGASSPEAYGNYYAWGETSTKSDYSTSNCPTYVLSISQLQSQGYIDSNGNLNPQYDAATANWGGDWRMPTYDELVELKNNCTWTWTTQNGVNGYKVTSKTNGNSIFLPVTGCRNGSSLNGAESRGYYWSSTPYESGSNDAISLYFDSSNRYMYCRHRYYGQSVRPVIE